LNAPPLFDFFGRFFYDTHTSTEIAEGTTMDQGAGASPLQQIRDGYGSLLRSLAQLLLFLLIILGLSSAITLPLWYFALNFKDAFTAAILLLLGGYLLFALGKRIYLSLRASDQPPKLRVRAMGLKAVRAVSAAGFVYLLLVLLSGPAPLVSIPYLIIGLLVLGYIFFVVRR
jgi:hypothetical protein